MNRTKIEWCDYTWNPVTGCLHGCPYCYARRLYKRFGRSFEPAFHEDRLDQPRQVKKPSRVFVGSVTDMFGLGIAKMWLDEVQEAARRAPQHTYIWLTKAPTRLFNGNPWQDNDWVGSTVTGCYPFAGYDVAEALSGLQGAEGAGAKFISFEPLLGPVSLPEYAAGILDWIIIGQQTGPGSKPIDMEWIADIKRFADEANIPTFIKDNCGWWSRYQDFPEVSNG